MVKCICCDEEAEYEYPKYYCRFHWADWIAGRNPEYRAVILKDLEELDAEEARLKSN